jgi:internalin A
MEIGFLKELGFNKIENIEELKTSRGTVAFDQREGTSKITAPDLRYFWKAGNFGLHVSEDNKFSQVEWENLVDGLEEYIPKLKVLYLCRTIINSFKSIEFLSHLEFLNLSENENLKEIHLENFNNLLLFNSSNCNSLSSLRLIGDFAKLEHIDVSNSHLQVFDMQYGTFPILKSINMGGNKLKKTYYQKDTPNLHFVYGIGPIEGIEGQFFEGKDLNIKRLRNFENIKQLAIDLEVNLQGHFETNSNDDIIFLDLGHLDIGTKYGKPVPDSLKYFSNLEYLCLGSYYPFELDNYMSEKWIKCKYFETTTQNSFKDLSLDFLEYYKNLKGLYCNNVNLDNIKFLENISSDLIILDITQNPSLVNLSPIFKFKSLKSLLISGLNKIDISIFLKPNFPHIELLTFRSVYLTSVDFIRNLPKIRMLDVSDNLITDVKPIADLPNLEILYFHNNPITEAEELNQQENQFKFLSLILKKQEQDDKVLSLIPKKVVMLGNHSAGKSSLLHFLLKDEFLQYNESTHILNIEYLDLNSESVSKFLRERFQIVNFNNVFPIVFFDFGGQDYYHGLYQMFSSTLGVQLVVYCIQDNEKIKYSKCDNGKDNFSFPLNYWLKEKEYLEAESNKPENRNFNPYFLIESKIDLNNYEIDFPDLLSVNQKPMDFMHFYLKKPTDFLENKVEHKNSNRKESLLRQILLECYTSVRQESQKFLDFKDKVLKSSFSDSLTIDNISTFKISGISSDIVKLELETLKNAGFILIVNQKIINSPKLFLKFIHDNILTKEFIGIGRKSEKDIEFINSSFPKEWPTIKSFLIFQKTMFLDIDKNEYIFPNFLPSFKESHESNFFRLEDKEIWFSLKFKDFIPFGMINNIVTHFGKEPNKKIFWRDAIYFIQHIDNKAVADVFIVIDLENLKINIFGKTRSNSSMKIIDLIKYKRYLWICILHMYWKEDFDFNFESFNSDYVLERNKPILDLAFSVDNEFYINYSSFQLALDNNESTLQVQNESGLVKRQFLSNFKMFTDKSIERTKRLMISYSKDDLSYVNEFIKYLEPLIRDGIIEDPWFCTKLEGGQDWDKEIQYRLQNWADIVCFVCSQNSFSASYIKEKEIKTAIKMYEDGKDIMIVPIILEPFRWISEKDEYNLGKFTALPYSAKPVTDFKKENIAWYIIGEVLRVSILNKLKPLGEDFYLDNSEEKIPKEVMRYFERIKNNSLDL